MLLHATVLSLGLLPPPVTQLARLPALYDAALANHPLATRMATAAVLAGTGDRLAQARERESATVKYRRAAAFVFVESIYRGVLQQPILMWLIATFRGSFMQRLLPAVSLNGCATIERVLINQFLVGPGVYYPLFFAVTGVFQGLSVREAWSKFVAQFPRIYGLNLLFWFPVQTVQFTLIPPRYKVPVICAAAFVWSTLLSVLVGSATRWLDHSRGKEGTRPRRPRCWACGASSVGIEESRGARFARGARGGGCRIESGRCGQGC